MLPVEDTEEISQVFVLESLDLFLLAQLRVSKSHNDTTSNLKNSNLVWKLILLFHIISSLAIAALNVAIRVLCSASVLCVRVYLCLCVYILVRLFIQVRK